MTNVSYITPGYVEALRLPIRKGRAFTEADQRRLRAGRHRQRGVRAALLQGPGRRRPPHPRRRRRARDRRGRRQRARHLVRAWRAAARRSSRPYVVYVPATQTTGGDLEDGAHLVLAVLGRPIVRSGRGLPEAIRQSVAAVDPLLPIAKMESMADVQAASLAQQRFMMSVVVGLGVVALLLAAIGIHGLIASSVSERKREFGIRLALGATSRQVLKDVVMPGIILAGVGRGDRQRRRHSRSSGCSSRSSGA